MSSLISVLKTRGRRSFQIIVVLAIFSLTLCLGTLFNQSNEGAFANLSTENIADWRIWKIKEGLLTSSPQPSSFLDEPTTDDACVGFDPALSWDHDPPECLRARQYRQVERVLAREKLAKHDHWYFTRPHNTATLEKLLDCFSTFPSPCPPRPLIISGWWYTAEVTTKGTSGEVIWQKGIMNFVEDLGLSFIAVGPYTNWITVAEMMPDVYRVLWGSDVDIVTCTTDPRCVAEYTPPIDAEDLSIGLPQEERGVIPIWALNVVDYWGAHPLEVANNDYWWGLTEHGDWSYQPLGQQWIATPWPLPGHVHLPYSIEEFCLPLTVTPHEERNTSVLLLAKRSAYFDYHFISPKKFWTQLSEDPGFDLLTTAKEEEGHPIPEGLISLGHKSREEYEELVGSVKALLGIGAPSISPSVYTALCQATPVVVAYFVERPRTDGWHLYSGHMQHGPAQMIGPPYVYSYFSGNYTQMSEAVHTAINTPIERYIPPEMKYEYGIEQMRKYLNRDTVAMYEKVLADNGGQMPRLIKHVRERCYELKRCKEVFPPGRLPSTPPQSGMPIEEPI